MSKTILFQEKVDCCGCGACLNICPKNAITMHLDEFNFIYPQIDEDKCIECGMCNKVCNFQKENTGRAPNKTYVAVSNNTNILDSASGGIFASFAKAILQENGTVYGASLEYIDGKLVPMHIGVNNEKDLLKLQGSKYVQSSIGRVYQDVKEQLEGGRMTLFSGTPCQVDGLKGFLRKEYDNLLTIDIICHGVPSEKFFQSYIEILETKVGFSIYDFKFRDKTYGWGLTAKYSYNNAKGVEEQGYINSGDSSYYTLFLESHIYRENCYFCQYASEKRCGDLTLGDFWGIENEHPELLKSNGGNLNTQEGVSCILVNTSQGEKFLKLYENNLKLWDSEFDKVRRANTQLREPSPRSVKREYILNQYRQNGYRDIEISFEKVLRIRNIKRKIKSCIPKSVKKIIKKVVGRIK